MPSLQHLNQVLFPTACTSTGFANRQGGHLRTGLAGDLPVSWRDVLGSQRTEDEARESLAEAQGSEQPFSGQFPPGAFLGIAVSELPHGKRARELRLRGGPLALQAS